MTKVEALFIPFTFEFLESVNFHFAFFHSKEIESQQNLISTNAIPKSKRKNLLFAQVKRVKSKRRTRHVKALFVKCNLFVSTNMQ